jgi:Cu(I)/Ag(I) efflux system membrane fusion protein
VASLKWPAMTMDFVLANPSLVDKLKAGSPVDIEFVERKPGEWVITRMDAKAAKKPAPPVAAPEHKGH